MHVTCHMVSYCCTCIIRVWILFDRWDTVLIIPVIFRRIIVSNIVIVHYWIISSSVYLFFNIFIMLVPFQLIMKYFQNITTFSTVLIYSTINQMWIFDRTQIKKHMHFQNSFHYFKVSLKIYSTFKLWSLLPWD